jgi:hypothetical protein
MTEPRKKTERLVADPAFIDEILGFRELNHPEFQALNDAITQLIEKPGVIEKITEWRKTISPSVLKEIKTRADADMIEETHILRGSFIENARLTQAYPEIFVIDDANLSALKNLVREHAPKEFEILEVTRKRLIDDPTIAAKVDADIAKASSKALKGFDITKIEGYTEANRGAIEKAVAEIHKEAKAYGAFGIFLTKGFGAAIENSFGREAWKNSKGKVVLKGTGTLTGLGLIVDAAARGKSTGPDGKPVERGAVWRLSEGVVGAVLAVGSAIHGGRQA